MSVERDSLERYLRGRGAQILGASINRAGMTLQATIGGAILAVGLGVSAVGWASGAPDEMAAGLGPIVAGAINLAVALGIRRRMAPETPIQVEMSKEGKALLLALYRQTAGWPTGALCFGGREHLFMRRKRQRLLQLAGYRTNMPLPIEAVAAILEDAAAAYNRVSAVISAQRDSPSIAKMASRVSLAADEAMAEIFHQAAILSRYPEGLDAARERLDSEVKALTEVAVRLESLVATDSGSLEHRLRSSVDDVLSELRFEQIARNELEARS